MSADGIALAPHSSIAQPCGPVVFVIMDGVGVGTGDKFDAVHAAHTPTLDLLREEHLYRTLYAHGTRVGLPSDGDMGNSEVGHNILGAGRIFDQGAKSVDKAIASGTAWEGPWVDLVAQVTTQQSTLHLLGLLSDGGVHSNMTHLFALVEQAHRQGVKKVRLHLLTDGRDVPDKTAEKYIEAVETHLAKINADGEFDYRIASGGGRMITTMDRYDADWRIVGRGWNAHVLGTARAFTSAIQAITTLRDEHPGISDQLLEPFTVCDEAGAPVGAIHDHDAVVLFNFRGDRAIEICQAFSAGDNFAQFDRQRVPDVLFAGMMLYDGDLAIPERYLVAPETVSNTVSQYIAATGLSQFACAETQKYGHVTYFWNGNRSDKFDDTTETYLEIPSDLVPFDERPWMKSAETADAIIAAIVDGNDRFIRANFASGDMVGHTGCVRATTIAVEAVDLALARILPAIKAAQGCLIVTADHGNADDMVERDKAGEALLDGEGVPRWRTSHSLNPVPFYVADFSGRNPHPAKGLDDAGLANVAATLIELLGYAAPLEYEPSLVRWD
jgi:2,3-bisphosphoglycerate-independent phosphoglycerate mutase